jgi:hypothetical protein
MARSEITVDLLIKYAVASDEYLYTEAIASCQIVDPEKRKQIATELRQGKMSLIAPRVYAHANPIGILMAPQYGVDLYARSPPPHITAIALCQQNGWKLSFPTDVAQYLLGVGERPNSLPRLPYDQEILRRYQKAGLELYPAPRDLSHLSPAGQALTIAIPVDTGEATLREIGERAARAVMSEKFMVADLQDDLQNGRFGEREKIVAETIVEGVANYELPLRAPPDFVPPTEGQTVPIVDYWWTYTSVEDSQNFTFLAARTLRGHPSLGEGKLRRSSALIWIDERLGYARTRSRIYRLGIRYE